MWNRNCSPSSSYPWLYVKKCLPRASPSPLTLPSTLYTQRRDLRRVFEMRWRALDCKAISKMQRAKKPWYLGKRSGSYWASSSSEQEWITLSKKLLLVPLQLTKNQQNPICLNTANKNSLQPPSSVISLSLCHEPHVPENLSLYLLPGLCSPLWPSSSLALPTQAELNPQTAAIGPLSPI